MLRIAFTVALLAVLAGCGGTSAPSPSSSSGQPSAGTPAPPPPVTPVSVTAGQASAGVDITVSSPASATAPNLQDVGAGNLCGAMNACNTGDIIHRGSTTLVLMFGPGLASDMKVSVNGPSDITFGTPVAIHSTTGTAGLQVSATVASGAALGARTIILRAPNGDITAFSGGLEVVP